MNISAVDAILGIQVQPTDIGKKDWKCTLTGKPLKGLQSFAPMLNAKENAVLIIVVMIFVSQVRRKIYTG